ncbi:hypothetical protein [Flavivirga rizhaonensis]|uniref:Glycosyltransferase RgtA/B/C/D-like domain-containing protein n=1 Tax=Flavivirga rizhaonensis TaxID=2559571 RepID=A0A4S1DWR8_9FLAO|nr:hypothetical protein [Flavivirga rizhaonensis]TGV02567.1 hypothetical protein EM932_10345 [Flavivirga rizhaonensis]
MIDFNKTIKNEFHLVLFIVILVQLILGFQGVDVCDDGFVLTFYQQIYNNPSCVEYNFVYWFSGVIGGVWYELYPDGGIIWFKFFTVIINTLIFISGYHIFKQFLPKRIAVLGLLVALFVNDFGFLIYYHNHLTALLAVLSVFFLLKGLIENHGLSIVISGCILGINVFTRIPNITLFIFILAIPFYYFINEGLLKKAIKPMIQYALGILIGFVIIVSLLLILDQFNIMQNAILSLFDLGAKEDSTHNISGLLKTYLLNYKHLIGIVGQFSIIIISFFAIYNSLKNILWLRNILLFVCFFYAFLWFKEEDVFTVYTMAYVGTLFVLFTKHSAKIKTLAFLGVLMLTFLPMGSGIAIRSSGYMCIWLSVPFFFHFFSNLKEMSINWKYNGLDKNIILLEKSFKIFILFISIAFFSAKALNVSRQAYFDVGSRLEKTHIIESELAKGVFTTERRAEIINDLLINLEKHVKPNDYLLAYDKIPLIHFLTKTKPYMYNPWIWIYDGYSFEQKIKKAETEIPVLPIVVLQKFETIGEFSRPMNDYMDETKEESFLYNKKRTTVMNSFLERNEYEIIWSNSYFNMYRTNKK